ncbi:MAG: hypothetical protein WBD46_04025 [Acidobacteriaceae bacterium]
MIGVIADEADHDVVREFFELFKTPWEYWRPGQLYNVVLCAAEAGLDETPAQLVVVYASARSRSGMSAAARVACELSWQGSRFPIYQGCTTFGEIESRLLVEADSGRSALQIKTRGQGRVVSIGYDLFAEVRTLLTSGQPAVHAGTPTLELHIALLRDIIAGSGLALTEIPPVPTGYRFIACLTHDVDHPLIRNHGFDHTTLGFLYRATAGSVRGMLRGRRRARDVWRNVAAAARLPLVHVGLAGDFWSQFDRYAALEKGARSSFFVIPFRDRPGRRGSGQAPSRRAARYGAAEIARQIRRLGAAGCEIGTHGIDAWTDSSAGRTELEEIRRIAGVEKMGIRMHWLYFNERSPEVLEAAGADYDSTVGYNETVGYRAGTTQVYQPLGCRRLLELPLHIMDTAMFYPNHLDLSPQDARIRAGAILDDAVRFGGCVTVNWHDRSIAPERCWGDFYVELIDEMRKRGAWFGTAGEVVAWFRQRRAARFEGPGTSTESIQVQTSEATDVELPGLDLRTVYGNQQPAMACRD